jgi:hypothetical protein
MIQLLTSAPANKNLKKPTVILNRKHTQNPYKISLATYDITGLQS